MNNYPDNQNIKLSDLSLEKEIIQQLIYAPQQMQDVYGRITTDDFLEPRHQSLYHLLEDLYQKGQTWDLLVVHSTLKQPEQFTDILYGLTDTFTFPRKTMKQLVKFLKKWSARRKIHTQSLRIQDALVNKEPEEIVSDSLSFFKQIESTSFNESDWSLENVLKDHYKLMEQRERGDITGITTGFPKLDGMLGQGFQRKDLIIVGARPSVGKTSFTLTLSYNAALKGYHSVFLSCEMDENEILDRLLAFHTGFSVNQIIRGNVELEKVRKAHDELKALPLSILNVPKATSSDVYAIAAKYKHLGKLDILFVDYLGYLSDSDDNEVVRLGKISKSLKTTANLLDVAVVAPHQLSRKIEDRPKDKQIAILSDLRDSGHLEQDADVVMFLNRDMISNSDKAVLRIAKNRTGETSRCDLVFNKLTTRFE